MVPGGVSQWPPPGNAFRVIAFDWDGTAVARRDEDAGPLCQVVSRLLAAGVTIAVITGTNRAHLDRQLVSGISAPLRRDLFLFTNRGSEVFGFDARGEPLLLWRRSASATEERLLTEVALAYRDELVSRTGLAVGLVLDRPNRRKVDLIPLPEWADPPKSQVGALCDVVDGRLKAAGVAGGLAEAVALAERMARDRGLDPRITSDAKHVEIGLTDKGDSAGWIMRELARPRGVAPGEILFAGDEFSLTAGLPGSDARMRTAAAEGAVFLSVGPEPGGAPGWVVHLPGGPERFRRLLESQADLHEALPRGAARVMPDPVAAPDLPAARESVRLAAAGLPVFPTEGRQWTLVETGFQLAREHEIESLFAIGNGHVGTRGALAEGSAYSSPATFVAGVFDQQADPGATPALLIVPDWLGILGKVDGRALKLEDGTPLEHRRVLDLRQGILWRVWRHRDDSGRVTWIVGLRLASLADRHLLVQVVTLTPENYCGRVQLEVAVSDDVSASRPPRPVVSRRTGRGHTVALAFLSRLWNPDGLEVPGDSAISGDRLVERWDFQAEIGRSYRFDRIVAVYSNRHTPDPSGVAYRHVAALSGSADRLIEDHRRSWEERWEASDIEVTGSVPLTRALRFASYHLISAANPQDDRVSIGARGLTGEAYRGHVFWDTDVFMLPFFAFTQPDAARALVMYRFHTLAAARERALAQGFRGALYAWESTETGEDATPPFVLAPDGEVIKIAAGEQEHHVTAAVAYGVWTYWQATGDEDFLARAGAEILLETARFWASRGRSEGDGRFHIRHVMGPDEYHEDVDDNAYTNGMAQWNLERGVEVARILQERWPEQWRELSSRLSLDQSEIDEWERLARATYTGYCAETGLFEQFRGFFDLEPCDPASFRGWAVPPDVILGRERVRKMKIIKQADVLMLLWLLRDRFAPEVIRANYHYYEPCTAHGSSLSPAIHAALAARLGKIEAAERLFGQAADVDLANNMGNAAGGVHLGAMGGLWQAAVMGFAGMAIEPEGEAQGVSFDPHLPASWGTLHFRVGPRGRNLDVTAGAEPPSLSVRLIAGTPLLVRARGGPAALLRDGGSAQLRGGAGEGQAMKEEPL